MSQDRVAVGEGQPQILPSPPRLSEGPAGDLQLEVCWARQVAAYRSRMQNAYAGDVSPRDDLGKAATYDLDFRKFRHLSL
jgi:hypothetical protein